jgi:hypothetical protein
VAVPSLILRLTPRPLAWFGLVVAAIGMVSTLTLLTSALDFTLPIGRFGGLIFIAPPASCCRPAGPGWRPPLSRSRPETTAHSREL